MKNKTIYKSLFIIFFTAIIAATLLFAFVGTKGTAYATSTDTWDGTIANSFASGDGTEQNPYIISTCAHLAYLAKQVNDGTTTYSGNYFELDNNVAFDLNGNNYNWTPIGYLYVEDEGDEEESTYTITTRRFCGHFDGNNAEITNISLDGNSQTAGLFGLVGVGGTVTNVNVTDVSVSSATMIAGGVAGINEGTITESSASGTITMAGVAGSDSCGALVGWNIGSITNCSVGGTISISGFSTIGGLVGDNNTGDGYFDNEQINIPGGDTYNLTNCSINSGATFTLLAEEDNDPIGNAGTIVGNNSSTVSNVIVNDDVTVTIIANSIGGITGYNSGTLSFVAFYGSLTVSGGNYFGGVSASNSGTVSDAVFVPDSLSLVGPAPQNEPLLQRVGGIVCDNDNNQNSVSNGTISGSYAKADLIATNECGGIVANNRNGAITNCFFEGSVYGEKAGGIAGNNSGTITKVLAVGRNGARFGIYGTEYAGGIVGYSSDSGSINNSFVIANVNAIERDSVKYYGGIQGNDDGTVTSTCYLSEIAFDTVGTGISYSEMFSSYAGLDGTKWVQVAGYAPKLKYFSNYSRTSFTGITDLYPTAIAIVFPSANKYSVTLDSNSYYVPYDYQFILPTATQVGYAFNNWSDGNDDFDAYEYVFDNNGNMAFTSVFTLDEIALDSISENVDKTYDGTASTISATFSHGLSISYQWYYSADGTSFSTVGTNGNTYSVTNVADSGYYYLIATVDDNNDSVTYDTRGDDANNYSYFEVRIGKADYDNVEVPVIADSYTYSSGLKLSDISLPTYYTWVNGNATPTVDVTSYPAKYNADPANYNDYDLNVALSVSKASYSNITYPEALSGTYSSGQTLSSFALQGNGVYRWAYPDTTPTVDVTSYPAKYNADPTNYNDFDLYITLNLEKGNYNAIDVDVPEGFAGTYDPEKTLGDDYPLTGYYYWENDSTHPSCTTSSYPAFYCDDANNYNPLQIWVSVQLDKADPVVTPVIPAGPYYVGQSLPTISLSVGDTEGTISWQNATEFAEGNIAYGWLFSPTEFDNYNEAHGTLSISASVRAVERIEANYNGQTEYIAKYYQQGTSINELKSFLTVKAYYDDTSEEFVSGSNYTLAYKNGEQYPTLDEDGDVVVVSYQGFTAEFKVAVRKMEITEPELDTIYSYTGSSQTIAIQTNEYYTVIGNTGTNAGSYTATITLKDTVNYKWKVSEGYAITIDWDIQKAVVSAPYVPATSSYDGQTHYGYVSLAEHVSVVSGVSMAVNAGSYSYTVAIDDTNNYSWYGGSSDNLVREWKIDKKSIAYPVAVARTYTFTGSTLTFEYTADEAVIVLNNTDKTIAAGDHEVVFGLTNYDNYSWGLAPGSIEYQLPWHVYQASVALPVIADVSYTYNGSQQTYSFTVGEGAMVDNYRATHAGIYTVTFSLPNNNLIWADDSTADIYKTWIISPKVVALPQKTSYYYQYTGEYITFGYDVDLSAVTVNNDRQRNVGDHDVSFSLKSTVDYIWNDSTTSVKSVTYTISPLLVDIPVASTSTFSYDGSNKTFYLGNNTYYTLTGNVKQNVGNYTATATLNNDNYAWSDGTTAARDYEWNIIKRKVPFVNYESETLIYNEGAQTTSIPSSELYTLTGNVATNVGDYQVTVALVDTANNEWSDGTTADFTFDWSIAPMPLALPNFGSTYYYTGELIEEEIVVYSKCVITGNVGLNVGSYTAMVALLNNNYVWADSTTDSKSAVWTILPAAVNIPVVLSDSVYSPFGATAAIASSDVYTIAGNTASEVGTYTATVSLIDKDNYVWKNGATNDINLNWKVVPATKEFPYLLKNLIYSGKEQTATIIAPEGCTVTGNKATNVGDYYATVSLNDKKNYRWEDDTLEDVLVEYSVYSLSLRTGEGEDSVLSYEEGTVLPTPTKENYLFAGWYDNAECVGDPILTLDSVDADTVLYAKWVNNSSSDSSYITPQPSAKSGLSTGAIVGIVVGGVGALIALCIILLALVKRK